MTTRQRWTLVATTGPQTLQRVHLIDVATDEPVQSVTVGQLPWGVVVSPN